MNMQSFSVDLCDRKNMFILNVSVHSFTIFTVDGTTYLLCRQNMDSYESTLTLEHEGKKFLCGFLKFLNLNYFNNLEHLLKHLLRTYLKDRHWIAVYQVISFSSQKKRTFEFKWPSYGDKVLIPEEIEGYNLKTRIVCNCFVNKKDVFYFIERQRQNNEEVMFGQIVDLQQTFIHGFCFRVFNMILCLPITLVLKNMKAPKLRINPQFCEILQRTVYLQIHGSNSTGTIYSKNTILTVKHAFPTKYPQVGDEINVKFYPYVSTSKAFITTKSVLSSMDAILLQFNLLFDKKDQTKMITKQSPLTLTQQCLSNKTEFLNLGSEIIALGFGKFNYHIYNFQQIDLMLPTIVRGIISKKIEFNNYEIAFKTDANMYHGFSGCGIWLGKKPIGMAVFIVKNSMTRNQLFKHNFCYSSSLINDFLLQQSKQKDEAIQQFIANLDKFGVRQEMAFLSKL